ncbi:hypothetical protein M0805_004616 [Coniferiporia weirii]|nr:hypothetical protein M0805_004616 [Coniferiporia weirii]
MATTLSRGLRTLRVSTLRSYGVRATRVYCPRWLSTSLPQFSDANAVVRRTDRETIRGDVDGMTEEEPVNEALPFSSLRGKVSPETLEAITVRPMKLTTMTPVQEAVLSMLPELAEPFRPDQEGGATADKSPRDLMVRAKTGTGKTLAFLVPAIESRVKAIEEAGKRAMREAGPGADRALERRARREYASANVGTLILSPTRELATQIANEAIRLSSHHQGFEVRLLTGGASKRFQLRDWDRGNLDIVVSTTGRLRDLLNSAPEVARGLKGTNILILDEADTMLDMGFREDIDAVLEYLPKAPERQTFVFSATINRNIEQVVRSSLSSNNTYIDTVSDDTSPVHAHVAQYHTVLPSAAEQLPHTLRLLAHDQLTNPGKSKSIVFLPTTKMTVMFAAFLRELAQSVLPAGRATKVYEIHSKRSMDQRVRTSDMFRKDKSGASILVTSDVSARGVDYPGISRVIQIGVPQSTEQYIHRVGRTGRMGGMVGRGDLVLLPWEVAFISMQLAEVPMKPITSKELEKQVTELGSRFDEDPSAFFPEGERRSVDRMGRPVGPINFRGPVMPKIGAIEDEVKQIMTTVDEETVNGTFMAMLGYYISKAPALRLQRNDVFEGCRAWVTQACGLPKAPHVSDSFLKKIGMGGSRNKSFGHSEGSSRGSWTSRGSGERRESGSGFGSRPQRPWDSRGSNRSWDGEGSREQRSYGGEGRREQRSFGEGGRREQKSFGEEGRRERKPWNGDDRKGRWE